MGTKLNIIFEDNHLLVVDKRAMLPTMGVTEDSLVKQAKNYLRHKYNKPGNVYIGVVSRLDSFVSGVIVLARTSKSASRLTDQFRRRSVRKTYLAIIPDFDEFADHGRLEHRLIKNEAQHRMMTLADSTPTQLTEKRAILAYKTLGRHQRQRLLEIVLETGRKHQIRVQLSAVGCPILGDRKYDSQITFALGIALHSHRLIIEHPTKKTPLSFQSEPPSLWRMERFG